MATLIGAILLIHLSACSGGFKASWDDLYCYWPCCVNLNWNWTVSLLIRVSFSHALISLDGAYSGNHIYVTLSFQFLYQESSLASVNLFLTPVQQCADYVLHFTITDNKCIFKGEMKIVLFSPCTRGKMSLQRLRT